MSYEPGPSEALKTTDTKIVIAGLEEFVQYNFTVVAVNVKHEELVSGPAPVATARTREAGDVTSASLTQKIVQQLLRDGISRAMRVTAKHFTRNKVVSSEGGSHAMQGRRSPLARHGSSVTRPASRHLGLFINLGKLNSRQLLVSGLLCDAAGVQALRFLHMVCLWLHSWFSCGLCHCFACY